MSAAPTLGEAVRAAAARLREHHETARLDAEVLLAHVLGAPRHVAYAAPERRLTGAERARFEALVARRAAGEPLAYLVGHREFWSLELAVTPDTLIPRPDTECLVEAALALIPADARWPLADLGTGTGAVALALARERPGCRVLATDASAAALAVARSNAARLGIVNVAFARGDWCAALARRDYALIAANPPYVAAGDPHLGRGDVAHEPRAALAAGADGLDALRAITRNAPRHLRPGGWLLLEHGYAQGAAVRALLAAAGLSAVATLPDLAGRARVTQGQRLA